MQKVVADVENRLMSKLAFIDLDGTLADYDLYLHQKLEEYPVEERTKQTMRVIKTTPGFWQNLPPIPEGFEVLSQIIQAGYDPHILTKGPTTKPLAWSEKHIWSKKYLPSVPVTITEDKSITTGDLLFDDWPPYIEAWLAKNPTSIVLMLDHPWNRNFNHQQVYRIYPNIPDYSFIQDYI